MWKDLPFSYIIHKIFILFYLYWFCDLCFRCGAKEGNPYCEGNKPKQRMLIEPLPHIQPLKSEQKHALEKFLMQLGFELNWFWKILQNHWELNKKLLKIEQRSQKRALENFLKQLGFALKLIWIEQRCFLKLLPEQTSIILCFNLILIRFKQIIHTFRDIGYWNWNLKFRRLFHDTNSYCLIYCL